VTHTAIQNDGYNLNILAYTKSKKFFFWADNIMVYPLNIKNMYIPRYPYLNISPITGKNNLDMSSAAYPLKV
jgi:hypothetical protein